MCRIFRLWSIPIGACVEFVDSDWTQSAHFSTVSTLRDPNWLLCRLCRLKLTLIIYLSTLSKKLTLVGSSVDSVNCIRLWLAYVSTLMSLSNLTDFDDRDQSCLHMRQVCRLWSNMISSYVDCVEWVECVDIDWRWLSHLSTLSNRTDTDLRMGRACRLKLTLIGSCVVSGDFYCTWFDLVQLCRQWSTLFFSFVDYVDIDWPWSSSMSTLLTVIETDWLMCRLCRLFLKMICSRVDFFGCEWTWSTQVATLSTFIDPDWLICRLC